MAHAHGEWFAAASHSPGPQPMVMQCAWCLEWIRGSGAEGSLPTLQVSHGLCSCCMERLTRTDAAA